MPCTNQYAQAGRIKTSAQKISKAWRMAELALAASDSRVKQRSLRTSSELVDKAIAQEASPATHAKAKILKSCLPALSNRAYNLEPEASSRRHANATLGELLLWRLEAPIAANIGWSVEALVLYLMSREGVASEDFLFAGSPREENSTKKRLNHDTYQLWPDRSGGPSKFPIQLKNVAGHSSHYDVPTLAVTPTLRPVLNAIGTDSIEPIMTMAAFESLGKTGPYQETVLDFAGHCLQTTITALMYQRIMTDIPQGR
jgi:hypothetical protein